jgi:hypothetical protein
MGKRAWGVPHLALLRPLGPSDTTSPVKGEVQGRGSPPCWA